MYLDFIDSLTHLGPMNFVWAGLFLFILELILGASSGFDFFLFGICLIAGGVIGNFVGGLPLSIVVSAGLALAHVFFFRPVLRKLLTPSETPTNADALLGQWARVTTQIATREPGQVRLNNGELWLAKSKLPLANGLEVKVIKVDGNSLWVEKN